MILFSWLYMQWTHELGHILAGLASGATIDRVILDPRTFSMTQFHSTPHPLIAAWGGPLLGVIIGAGIPLILTRVMPWFRFSLSIVAAFVLLANGLYIGLGAAYPVGDAQSLIKFGAPRWLMVFYAFVCVIPARFLFLRSIRQNEAMPKNQLLVFLGIIITMSALGVVVFPA